MTKLVWYSRTGQTARAMRNFENNCPLEEYDGHSPFILAIPSYCAPRTGQYVPKPVKQFLAQHAENMVGVVGTGNSVFAHEYCLGAVRVAAHYGVPLVSCVDLALTQANINEINQALGD